MTFRMVSMLPAARNEYHQTKKFSTPSPTDHSPTGQSFFLKAILTCACFHTIQSVHYSQLSYTVNFYWHFLPEHDQRACDLACDGEPPRLASCTCPPQPPPILDNTIDSIHLCITKQFVSSAMASFLIRLPQDVEAATPC